MVDRFMVNTERNSEADGYVVENTIWADGGGKRSIANDYIEIKQFLPKFSIEIY